MHAPAFVGSRGEAARPQDSFVFAEARFVPKLCEDSGHFFSHKPAYPIVGPPSSALDRDGGVVLADMQELDDARDGFGNGELVGVELNFRS